jgi:hypothetical protein
MDWYKKYRFRTMEETDDWPVNFNFIGRRLTDPEFKIECYVTEEEFFSKEVDILVYYGDFKKYWPVCRYTIVLNIVENRKKKLKKLD